MWQRDMKSHAGQAVRASAGFADRAFHTMTALTQAWPRPSHPRPIVVIGSGSIVRTAHLPAYRRLGLPVAGIFDIRRDIAEQTAVAFAVERVYPSLQEACAVDGAVFDVAVPGDRTLAVLQALP